MIVVLCHADDAAAIWLSGALSRLGVRDVELVSVEQLVFSCKIVHCLDNLSDRGEVHLWDGRVLRVESINGLVNRMRYLPTQHLQLAGEADRSYAAEELSAFFLAWLDGIKGRVINPATAVALDGAYVHPVTCAQSAAICGFPVGAVRVSPSPVPTLAAQRAWSIQTSIVFDDQMFGACIPSDLQSSCRRLARLSGMSLMQVELHRLPEGTWQFASASGAADFRIGGEELVRALARSFDSGD